MIVVVVIVALIIIAGVVGFTFINSANTNSSPTTTPPDAMMDESMNMEEDKSATPGASETGGAMESEQGTIVVNGSSFAFSPKSITVKKGEKVTILFKNTGGVHDFTIDEFDIKTKQIQSGQSEEVSFTPTETGTFEYYCSVGNHRQMGMTGTLIVE